MISRTKPAIYACFLAALAVGGIPCAQSAGASDPPDIYFVQAYPATLGPNETVQLVVSADDEVDITDVTANGVDLSPDGYGDWCGDLCADPSPGQHTIVVTATDSNGNVATNSASSYLTLRLVMLSTRAAQDSIIFQAQLQYRFKFCGEVSVIDPDNFTLDDGCGTPLPVSAYGHGLETGNYAAVYGALSYDFLDGPSLASSSDRVSKLN